MKTLRLLSVLLLASIAVHVPVVQATVTTTAFSVTYTGNGSNLLYTVPFKFLSSSDLIVTVNNVTKVLGIDYSVSGAGSITGGSVLFNSPPPNGQAVVITRSTPSTQPTSLPTQGPFFPPIHENAWDRLTLQIQEKGALQGPPGPTGPAGPTGPQGPAGGANTTIPNTWTAQQTFAPSAAATTAILATGNTTGIGVAGTGGATSGYGVQGTGGAPNGFGVVGIGTGTGYGVQGTGGGTSAAGGNFTGGTPNGPGVTANGVGTAVGLAATGGGSNATGVNGNGGATNGIGGDFYGAGSGTGVRGTGGVSGVGGLFNGGSTSGVGIIANGGPLGSPGGQFSGGSGGGAGVVSAGVGTGSGVEATSGLTGYGLIATGNATRATIRYVPQATAPTTPLPGDTYFDNTGNGTLRIYNFASMWVPDVTWTAPTLLNSWVNFGAPFSTVGYFMDRSGFVHLRGSVKNGTASAVIFVLPAGYRPSATKRFAVNSGTGGGTTAAVTVDSSGNVTPLAGATSQYDVEGITFDTR
jgi:hypothetical protein